MHNGCHSTKVLQISGLMIPHRKWLAGYVKKLDESNLTPQPCDAFRRIFGECRSGHRQGN
jgi:hypothetical protein